MSENWTPGPWISKRPNGMVKTPDDVKLIASCYGDDPECHEDERQIAKARLIAAAPQLYEALKPFAIFLNGMEHARHIGKDGPLYVLSNSAGTFRLEVDDFVAARAALSAARGDGV